MGSGKRMMGCRGHGGKWMWRFAEGKKQGRRRRGCNNPLVPSQRPLHQTLVVDSH